VLDISKIESGKFNIIRAPSWFAPERSMAVQRPLKASAALSKVTSIEGFEYQIASETSSPKLPFFSIRV